MDTSVEQCPYIYGHNCLKVSLYLWTHLFKRVLIFMDTFVELCPNIYGHSSIKVSL